MNVDLSLKLNLMAYPTIFQSKWDVYHHWFVVIGNGYEWIGGRLVYDHPALGERLLQNKFDTETIKQRLEDFTPSMDTEMYPLCEWAKIMKIPNNIQPDWKEAATEFLQYMLDNPDFLSDEDKTYLPKIKKQLGYTK